MTQEHSAAVAKKGTHTTQLSDDWADDKLEVNGQQGCLRACTALRREHPHLKVILSIGGGGKGGEHFACVASDPKKRANFATTARELCDHYSLDGIDSSSPPSAGDTTRLTIPSTQLTGNTRPPRSEAKTTSPSSPPSDSTSPPRSSS